MADAITFQIKKYVKALEKASKEMKADIEKASIRALNVVTKKALSTQVKAVAKSTGQKQSTIKKGVKTEKARKGEMFVVWTFSGARFSQKGAKPIMRKKKQAGVQFTSPTGKKVRLTDYHKGGSKPFRIFGANSGKPVAVYREPGSEHTVTTIQGSSRQHIVKFFSFPEARKQVQANLHREIKNQLKRSKYIKRR